MTRTGDDGLASPAPGVGGLGVDPRQTLHGILNAVRKAWTDRDAMRKNAHGTLLLIGADLLLVPAVLLLGWDVFDVAFLFWCENVVIGFWAIFRMASAMDRVKGLKGGEGGELTAAKAFIVPFFLFHYGFFCYGHGSFLVEVLAGGRFDAVGEGLGTYRGLAKLHEALAEGGLGLALVLAAVWVAHGVFFVRDYIGKGEYRRALTFIEMFRPYGRVVLLHVAIIAGGLLFLLLPRLFVLGFIPLKIGYDLVAHSVARSLRARREEPAQRVPDGPWPRRHAPALLRLAIVVPLVAIAATAAVTWKVREWKAERKLQGEADAVRAKVKIGMTLREALEAAGPWATVGDSQVALCSEGDGRYVVWLGRRKRTFAGERFGEFLDRDGAKIARGSKYHVSYDGPDGRDIYKFHLTFDGDGRVADVGPALLISY